MLTKELQDLAWNCLPLEVKKEVKRQYQIAVDSKAYAAEYTLGYLFGIHNLTSDAEGEEILYGKASRVKELYQYTEEREKGIAPRESEEEWYQGYIKAMQDLFGPKCLPDEKINPESLVTTIKDSMEHPLPDEMLLDGIAEPKPSEPKFKVGDEVVWDKRIIARVDEILNDGDYIIYSRIGKRHIVHESDLEPYTEQEASTCTDDCSSQCTSPDHIADASKKADDDLCYKLIQRGFRNHNRLNIATRIATAILGNPDEVYRAKTCGKGEQIPQNIAEYAVAIADALIAEAEKGGLK